MAILNDNFDLEQLEFDDGPMANDKAPLIGPSNGGTGHNAMDFHEVSVRCGSDLDENRNEGERCCDNVLKLGSRCLNETCTVNSLVLSALRCFPFVRIMVNYNWRKNVLPDVVAGITIGIMNIPQGMAYAILAELEPVVGLYVSFFAPLLYFFFGTSLQMSVGTFALASLMLAEPVTRLAGDHVDPLLVHDLNVTLAMREHNMTQHEVFAALRWEVALSVSLLVGLLQIGMGALRLGFLAVFLSDALASGFTTGAAFHVFTSQLPQVFGVKIRRHSGTWKLIKTYKEIFTALPHTNIVTLAISASAILLLIIVRIFINPRVMRRFKFPIPIELLLVICGTVTSYLLHLHARFNVEVIGTIPSGFPTPRIPSFRLMPNLIMDSVTIAIFIFGCTVSLAKIFSRKHKYELDANQEAFALGLINTITPFFGAYMAAGSLSRSMVQDEMGGKSQLASLISSVLILVVLLAIGPLFSAVPDCILSCIILISLKGLFRQFVELPKLWRACKFDCAIWIVTFLCTLLLDVGLGLFVGFAFSLLTVVARAHVFSATISDDDVIASPSQISVAPATRVLRFEGPLYFGSAERLRSSTLALLGLPPASPSAAPHRLLLTTEGGAARQSSPLVRCAIVDCTRVTFIDSAGRSAVESLASELEPLGVELILVDSPRSQLKTLGVTPSENITLCSTMVAALQLAAQHNSTNSDS